MTSNVKTWGFSREGLLPFYVSASHEHTKAVAAATAVQDECVVCSCIASASRRPTHGAARRRPLSRRDAGVPYVKDRAAAVFRNAGVSPADVAEPALSEAEVSRAATLLPQAMKEHPRDRLECSGRSQSLCMFPRRTNIQRLWLRPQQSKMSASYVRAARAHKQAISLFSRSYKQRGSYVASLSRPSRRHISFQRCTAAASGGSSGASASSTRSHSA
jgi:hypothetical protein